jgi:hypothetical protein
MSQDMEHQPILLRGTDKMMLRYTCHKLFKIHKTNEGTLAGVHRWGLKKGHSFSLGLHTIVFQIKIYAIKACTVEDIEKCYKDRIIYILLDNQAAIMVLNNFHINSKLVWDCHQSPMKLVEHNGVQLVWVLGNMGIGGN